MANPPTQIIDIHQHVNWLGRDEHGLSRYLRNLGVSKCWLLSWEEVDGGLDWAYEHLSIEQVFVAWEMYRDQIIPFAGVDCRRDNPERMLRECHARGARGYGEIKWHAPYDNPDGILMFRLAGELGMPVIVHVQYATPARPHWWYGGHITALERAVKLCPGTNFLGHAQSWWAHISGGDQADRCEASYPKGKVLPGGETPRLLAAYPNLYGDLSGGSGYNALTRDPEFGRQFLIDFADKLCYGVDNYDDRLLTFINGCNLPADVYEKIMGGNARKLLPV